MDTLRTIRALYDKNTWLIMIRKATVTSNRKIKFNFISGKEYTYNIPDRWEWRSPLLESNMQKGKTELSKGDPGYRLTDEDKNLIASYTLNGFGYRRIARLTGFKEGNIKSLLYRHRDDPFYYRRKGICPQCGKQVHSIPHKRERKFCSDECRSQWWASHRGIINKKAIYPFTCKQCGKDFEAYGQNHRLYCSRECYAEARRTKEPKKNKTKDSNIYTLNCVYCGREFKSLGVPDKKYCSRPCENADTEKADE